MRWNPETWRKKTYNYFPQRYPSNARGANFDLLLRKLQNMNNYLFLKGAA
jgi:hypothetical protein